MASREIYSLEVNIGVRGDREANRSLRATERVAQNTEKRMKLLDKIKASPVAKLIDKVTKPLQTIEKNISGFAKRATNKLAGFAATGLAAIGGFSVIGALKEFTSFERGMNEVYTLLPNMSETAFNKLKQDMKNFSNELGVLPQKAIPALYQALSAGVPENNVIRFMETATKASIGGVTELETAVDGITTVINSYGTDVIDAAMASDLMFTAVKLGKTTFSELSSTLYNVLGSAKAANVGFDQVSAAIATITSQGTPTAQATTQIRSMFDELNKTGSKVSDMFKKLSGKSFSKFMKEGGNVQEALQMLEKHAGKNNITLKDLFTSVEAGGAALSLTGKGTEKFTSDLKAMANASGATDEAFNKMDKGLGRVWDKIKTQASTKLIDIGDLLAPVVESLGNGFLGALGGLEEFIVQIQNKLVPKLEETGIKLGELKDTILPDVDFNFSNLGTSIVDLAEGALTGLNNTLGFVNDNFHNIIGTLIAVGVAFLTYSAIVGGVSMLETGYIALLYAKDAALWLVTAAQGALNAVMLMNPIALMIALLAGLVAGLIYLWNTSDTAREKISSFFSGLKQWGLDACNAVIGALNSLINLINKIPLINIPNIPNVGGGDSGGSKGKGKKYANGGIIDRPHYGLVGEAGPEAIIPLSSGRRNRAYDLWSKTGDRLGFNSQAAPKYQTAQPKVSVAGGGNNINVDINLQYSKGDNIDKQSIIEEAKRQVGEELKKALEKI